MTDLPCVITNPEQIEKIVDALFLFHAELAYSELCPDPAAEVSA